MTPKTYHAVDAMERIATTLRTLRECRLPEPTEIRLPTHEAIALAQVAADAMMPVFREIADDPDLGPYYSPGEGPLCHAYTHDHEGRLIPIESIPLKS